MSLLANNLSKKSKGQKLLEDKEALEVLAGLSDGYSCHSINIIADDASMLALKGEEPIFHLKILIMR